MHNSIATPPTSLRTPPDRRALGRDLRGGLATLMGSLCIAALIPSLLNGAGGNVTSVAATAFACVVGTALFASFTRLPFAVGPGIVPASIIASWLATGMPWTTVLGIELVAALLFALLVALGLVGRLVRRMPPLLKTAGEIAIGLYLLIAALRAGGVMQGDLGDAAPSFEPAAWVFLAGLAAVFVLARHPRFGGYATLIGVAVAAIGSAALGLVSLPDRAWAVPTLALHVPDVGAALSWRHVDEVLILLYVVLVDVVATLETLARCEPELQGADGSLRGFDRALHLSAAVFVASPLLGTAPMLVFFESLGGVLSGARTARAAFVAVAGFTVVMFYSPLASAIPAGACAVALAFVGYSITKHAALSMPWTSAEAGVARLGRHLATAALLLVVVAHYLAMALFALFALYPMLAHFSGHKPRPADIAAAVMATALLATILM